jgi:hypothetical protein
MSRNPLALGRRSQADALAFKRWFGSSKAVDPSGRPLVLFHGTAVDFDVFEVGRRGAFFAENASFASSFCSGEGGGRLVPVFLRLLSPYVCHVGRRGPEISALMARAKKAGHDGALVTYDDFPGERVFVVFRPEQIKSAIGNCGDFSPESPNISMSRAARQRAP